jgi:hypothetical protein
MRVIQTRSILCSFPTFGVAKRDRNKDRARAFRILDNSKTKTQYFSVQFLAFSYELFFLLFRQFLIQEKSRRFFALISSFYKLLNAKCSCKRYYNKFLHLPTGLAHQIVKMLYLLYNVHYIAFPEMEFSDINVTRLESFAPCHS